MHACKPNLQQLFITHAYNVITTCAYNIPPLLVQRYQVMSKAKHRGGRQVHSECLSSEFSFTPEGTFLVGGSSVIAFGPEMERSSVVVEGSSTLVEVFFLTWSKCLLKCFIITFTAKNQWLVHLSWLFYS